MLLLAALLLCYTIRRTEADIWHDIRNGNLLLLAVSLMLYGFMQVLGSCRWRSLLSVLDIRFSLWTALRLTLVGNFFSVLIPGAVSGDVLKIAFSTERYPGRKTELALACLMDRIIGMAGLFFTALTMLAICVPGAFFHPLGWGWIGIVAYLVLAVCLCMALGFCMMRFGRIPECLKFSGSNPGSLRERLRCLQDRLEVGIKLYGNNGFALLRALATSCLIHFLHGTSLFLIGRALGEAVLGFFQYNLIMQISNAAGAVPCFPGGIGLRDLVGAELLKLFAGTEASLNGSIPVIYTIAIVFWGIVGALVYISNPSFSLSKITSQSHK